MSSDPTTLEPDDDIDEWIPYWNTRWHVLLGLLLVGAAVLVHGAAGERFEDALTGGLLLASAGGSWYLQRRGRVSASLARFGGLLGLWLVTATLLEGSHRSLLMVGSLVVGVLLVVTDVVFYNLLKSL